MLFLLHFLYNLFTLLWTCLSPSLVDVVHVVVVPVALNRRDSISSQIPKFIHKKLYI